MDLNRVILIGRTTADPELKTAGDTPVCDFTLAVNRRGKDSGADFFRCVAFRKTAETVAKFVRKGSELCVVGSVQIEHYTDKEGTKRTAPKILVNEVALGAKPKDMPTEQPTSSATAPVDQKEFFTDLIDAELPF